MNVHELVVSKIADLSRVKKGAILEDHTLLGDIRMDEDDFSFLFVPELERAIAMELPQSDWEGIRTVGEVIRLLERKLQSRTQTASPE